MQWAGFSIIIPGVVKSRTTARQKPRSNRVSLDPHIGIRANFRIEVTSANS